MYPSFMQSRKKNCGRNVGAKGDTEGGGRPEPTKVLGALFSGRNSVH